MVGTGDKPPKEKVVYVVVELSPELTATAKMSILPMYGDGRTWHEVKNWTIRGGEAEITDEVEHGGN